MTELKNAWRWAGYLAAVVYMLGSYVCLGQGVGAVPGVRLEPGEAAHWTVTVRQEAAEERDEEAKEEGDIPVGEGGAGEVPEVVRSEYVVTGQTGRAVTKEGGAGGKRVEIYLFRQGGDTLLFKWSETGRRVVPTILDQYVGPEMRFSRRYPGMDWVRADDYRGVVEYAGRRCHHFAMAASVPEPGELAARADALAYDPRVSGSAREAWFDAATGLPVGFRDGTRTGKYRHHEVPGEAVKLPAVYEEALRYYYGAGARPSELAGAPATAPDPPEDEVVEEEE